MAAGAGPAAVQTPRCRAHVPPSSACLPPASLLPSSSGGRLIEYQGDRSARHLRDWALAQLPKHVKTVAKEAQLSDFLRQCQGGGGAGGAAGARWGVCTLLLSDKGETSALYKSLAMRCALVGACLPPAACGGGGGSHHSTPEGCGRS